MKDFELIYASQLRQKQRESRALVIDIRDRKEYEREHWPGAVSYPYDQLEQKTARLPKNRKLILYCDHGEEACRWRVCLGNRGIMWQVWLVVMRR